VGGNRPENVTTEERTLWYERLRVTPTPEEGGNLRLRVCSTKAVVAWKRSTSSFPKSLTVTTL